MKLQEELNQIHNDINLLINEGRYDEAKKLIREAEKKAYEINLSNKEGIVIFYKTEAGTRTVSTVLNGIEFEYDAWISPMSKEGEEDWVERLVVFSRTGWIDFTHYKKLPQKYREAYDLLRSSYDNVNWPALDHTIKYTKDNVIIDNSINNLKELKTLVLI